MSALGLLLSTSTPAHAGVYSVYSCDGTGRIDGWTPEKNVGAADAYLVSCGEGMVARSVVSADRSLAPPGSMGRWVFRAPAGTRLVSLSADYRGYAMWPWYTGFKNTDNDSWQFCMDFCESTLSQWSRINFGGLSQGGIALETQCWATTTGCRRDGDNRGASYIRNVLLGLADDWAPTVRITGGSLTTSGWKRGTQSFDYSGTDNTGIRTIRVSVDGAPVGRDDRQCDVYRPVPCDNAVGSMPIDTRAVFRTDGQHVITIEATDGGYNTASSSRTVTVDNTPPGQPDDLSVAGAGTWTSSNHFVASWRAGSAEGAPIAATRYQLCPVGGPATACATRRQDGPADAIDDLQLPSEGAWTLRLWQQDAAGNEDADRSAVVEPLLLDTTPPEVAVRQPAADDPDRVQLSATDATSGVATVTLEIRRHGTDAWLPVPVTGDAADASAVLNDEALARGAYDIRARATDRAGNERTTTVFANGVPAAIALPARVVTNLRAGKLLRHGKRVRMTRVVRVRHGDRVAIAGRLTTPGGNPLAAASIDVFQRVSLAGQPWRRIGSIRTSSKGRFRYQAPAGPNRVVRFHYAGTPTLRGSTGSVQIDVPAATTLHATPNHTVNGAYVRFHGRLRGHWTPRGGKLVELQVYSRRRWRTFAQPRADGRTRRWHYDYRFETVVGHVVFRFRARIRKEAVYPFETGRSGPIKVRVTGV